jgi:hypothetical protein
MEMLQACLAAPVSQQLQQGHSASRDIDTVLFLDVDGVLHPYINPRLPMETHDELQFNPACMQLLREILSETGAAIVLSSAWRIRADSRNRLLIKLRQYGLPPWVSVTRTLPGNQRPREILEWVEKHEPACWVALDDIPLHLSEKRMNHHFVQTNAKYGLQRAPADRVKELFAKQQQHREWKKENMKRKLAMTTS